jgi:hypothetical protein
MPIDIVLANPIERSYTFTQTGEGMVVAMAAVALLRAARFRAPS